LVDYGLFGGVLRMELPDAVKLIGKDTPHSEGSPGQEAALDAVIEPVEFAGFGSSYG